MGGLGSLRCMLWKDIRKGWGKLSRFISFKVDSGTTYQKRKRLVVVLMFSFGKTSSVGIGFFRKHFQIGELLVLECRQLSVGCCFY